MDPTQIKKHLHHILDFFYFTVTQTPPKKSRSWHWPTAHEIEQVVQYSPNFQTHLSSLEINNLQQITQTTCEIDSFPHPTWLMLPELQNS